MKIGLSINEDGELAAFWYDVKWHYFDKENLLNFVRECGYSTIEGMQEAYAKLYPEMENQQVEFEVITRRELREIKDGKC